jgi:hypothetical protein
MNEKAVTFPFPFDVLAPFIIGKPHRIRIVCWQLIRI